jgi:hypothetical protein
MEALQHFLEVTGGSSDGEFIAKLISKEVLTPLNGKGEFPEGTIFVPCSDGHRFGDVYHHHSGACFNGSDMQMPLASPGGAMLGAGDKAIEARRPYSKHNLLLDIAGSIEWKSCPTVVLYTHTPCAMARLLNLNVQQVLTLHAHADANVCTHLANNGHECATIISCFHIDFAELGGSRPDFPENLRFRTYEFHPLRFMYK